MPIDDLAVRLPTFPEACQAALKLSFLAPSGYGKTMAARLMTELFGSVNVRLGEPLYDLQRIVHSFIGRDIRDSQDGELLQFFGAKIQRERPEFLALRFFETVCSTTSGAGRSIITNDDCRPHNYPYLKAWGFNFVAIDGFPRFRSDHTRIDPLSDLEWHPDHIPRDFCLRNTGSVNELRAAIKVMMGEHFNVQEMLRYTDANGVQR